MTRTRLLSLCLLAGLSLAACATMQGAGKDLQSAGAAISDAADG